MSVKLTDEAGTRFRFFYQEALKRFPSHREGKQAAQALLFFFLVSQSFPAHHQPNGETTRTVLLGDNAKGKKSLASQRVS